MPPPTAGDARGRSRAGVLAAVCLGAIGMPMSFTGPAVALTALHDALGGSPAMLAWVTNAFMLSFGACLMVAGSLADAVGRRRVFRAGLWVVIFSSLAMSLLPGQGAMGLFVALRAVQGLGSAAVFAGGMAALAQAFDGPGRARVFSLVGTSFGAGLSFGPLLSGWLLSAVGWRAVTASVIVVALLSLALGWRSMAESRNPDATGLDVPGAASFTCALALLTWGVMQVPAHGWRDLHVLLPLAGALLSLAAFVRVESRSAQPMLDLSLLRHPRFVGVQLLAAAPAYGFVVLLILLPIRFIGVERMSPLVAGQLVFALSLPMLVVPPVVGWLVRWVSAARLCSLGLGICAAGLLWLARCQPGTPILQMAAPLLLIGAGMSLPWGLMDGLAVSVVPVEQAGMAAGIFNTVRVAGEGIALAVVGAALSGWLASGLAHAGDATAVQAGVQQLLSGNLSAALAAMPGLSVDALLGIYGQAFSTLLQALAAVTALTACVVFAFLRQPGR